MHCYHGAELHNSYLIATTLLKGGSLLDRLNARGPYPDRAAANTIRQILSGVSYLHDLNICHRDLKLENIMYGDRYENSLRIVDFGLAEIDFMPNYRINTITGTPGYMAPETIKGYDQSIRVDCWAVGYVII
ncbi:calcium-dependent protein kinase 1 [Phellopilus nigrolimitatus]|nr:calcium-dependent protein kinase 1 [Phellopilus nigrolimitatus]